MKHVEKLWEKFEVGKYSVQAIKYVGLNIVQHIENVISIQSIQVSSNLKCVINKSVTRVKSNNPTN